MNTGDFPTVGDSVLSYVGCGGTAKPSKGKMVASGIMGRGKSPTGSMGYKSSNKIQEANGPKCQVVAKLYEANAACASETRRNVRLMPSAAGTGDFFKERRQFGTVY
jgi:hypothetical protein